ncbi:MAG TPA: hypothetical protein VIP53_07480 [Nitrososphaera sp.]
MTVEIVALPALLPFGTAIFVLVVAGASAIAKSIRYYISRHGRVSFDSSYLQKK